jgi:hypothetical protein
MASKLADYTLGQVGNILYYASGKADGGYDFYKQEAGKAPFKLSQADAQKEIAAGGGGQPADASAGTIQNTNTYINSGPTLPAYIPMSYTMDEANASAAGSVNPYYDTLLKNYMTANAQTVTRANEDLATANKNYDTQSGYASTDLATSMANLATGAKQSGATEALSANANKAAAEKANAQSGLTFSGVGNTNLNQNDVARRLALAGSASTLAANQAAAQTTNTRAQASIGTAKTAAATSNTRALQDAATAATNETANVGYQRAADIAGKASDLYNQQLNINRQQNPGYAV